MGSGDRESIMRTLFHEARHGYQSEVTSNWYDRLDDSTLPKTHPYTSDATAQIWYDSSTGPKPKPPPALGPKPTCKEKKQYEEEYREYYILEVQRPVQYDAMSFAGQVNPEYMGEDVYYELNPPHIGSWDGIPPRP